MIYRIIKRSRFYFFILEVGRMEPLQKEHAMCSNTQTINKKYVDTRIRVRVIFIK